MELNIHWSSIYLDDMLKSKYQAYIRKQPIHVFCSIIGLCMILYVEGTLNNKHI